MTSIRTLSFIHTLGYIILISILTIVTRWLWIFPQQQQVALDHQEQDLASIQNAIRTVHDNLTYLASDYSDILEIQDFVKAPSSFDPEIGKEEFGLVRHELEYFVIADVNNNVISGLYRLAGNYNILELTDKQKESFKKRLSKTNPTDIVKNFETFRNHPVMAVTHPIRDNSDSTLLGRLIVSWKLHGVSLQQIADIVQLQVKPSTKEEINQSEKLDLYKEGLKQISRKHIRCLYDPYNTKTNCLTIFHNEKLIPEFLTIGILARIFAFSLVPLIFFIIMLNYFIRPLEQSTRFLRNTSSKKGITHLTEKAPILELEEMRIAFNELVDVTHQQRDLLESQSLTDALTKISNRRAFDEEMKKVQNRLLRHSGSAAIIMCDIDYFKLFNDHYGHQHGDDILKTVATTLNQFGNRSDEICARYGGEEFALILSNIQLDELNNIMKKIIKRIYELEEPHAESPFSRLTLSCGAIYINSELIDSGNDSAHQWIESADKALYKAKELGRNRYQIFNQ